MLFMRGSTSYEWQIGPIYGGWCFLQGGHWKYWWQPSRWYFGWDKYWMEDEFWTKDDDEDEY